MTQEKDINYWKNNCEEDYMTTPISVLRYISELEKLIALLQQEICISCDEKKETHEICMDCIGKMIKENQQEISDDDYPELEGTMELCNDKVWDDIYEEYSMEQYPPFGGPFTDSISFIDWLKLYYKVPEKK